MVAYGPPILKLFGGKMVRLHVDTIWTQEINPFLSFP
jgi:hypothetical protein